MIPRFPSETAFRIFSPRDRSSGIPSGRSAGKRCWDCCLPLLQAMGVKIIHVGKENGQGTTLKLINNLVIGVAIEAMANTVVRTEG